MSGSDEFADIARRFAPLTFGAPEALGLLDDAAIIAARPGFDLVITQDALVEGVHFMPQERGDRVAQKLLRTNLSDLAAKGAEPYGCFLSISWPTHYDHAARDLFAAALKLDLAAYGLALFGGDTTSTPGPLTASLTALGWVKAGGMVRRAGARAGDLIFVSGTIGDAHLGLRLARGEDLGLCAADQSFLLERYHCPQPRLSLGQALLSHANAAADVSDGLVADCGHIGRASHLGMVLDLDRLPVSPAARHWIEGAPDPAQAFLNLATGGDDYEIVCAVPEGSADGFVAAGLDAGLGLTRIGRMTAELAHTVCWHGQAQPIRVKGYQHP
jgi:thiamine-monophosphate kinase